MSRFASVDEALRDPRVYDRALVLCRRERAKGRHEGPRERISDREVWMAVDDVYETPTGTQ